MSAHPPSATDPPAGTPRTKEDTDHDDRENLRPLLSHLLCDVAALWLLPAAFLEEAVADLRLPAPAAARVHMALARLRPKSPAPPQTLERYLSEKEAREDEPWRREARKAQVQLDAFARAFATGTGFAELKKDFLAGAKGGLFSEDECVVLSWLLCSPLPLDRSAFLLATFLVRVPASSRTAVHVPGPAGGAGHGHRADPLAPVLRRRRL